ncbi:MAG: hypothetical protein ACK56F_11815, partial [bacterium]
GAAVGRATSRRASRLIGCPWTDFRHRSRHQANRSAWALPRGVIIFAMHAVQPVWWAAPQPRPVSPSKYS